jgi:hypothetical protein
MTSVTLGSPLLAPLRAGTPPPVLADRIVRARKGGNPTQIILSEMTEDEIEKTIDCLVAANGLTDAFLLNAIGPHTVRLNLTSCYHIRKYTLGMIASQCRNLQSINLSNCRQTDNKLVSNLLTMCPNLSELILENCVRVTDAAFFPPESLTRLTVLSLSGCRQVSEDAIVKIAQTAISLKSINLAGCRHSVTPAVVLSLLDLSVRHGKLNSMDISDCAALASDEAFVNFFASQDLVPLKSLKLAGLSGLPSKYTWKTIQAIAYLCGPHLLELDTAWSTSVTDEACFALATNCPNLVKLNLCNSPLSVSGVELLLSNLSNLEELDLSWCTKVHAKSVCSLALGSLKKINISHCVDFLRPDGPLAINPATVVGLVKAAGQHIEGLYLWGIPKLITAEVQNEISKTCASKLLHFSGCLGGDSVMHAFSEFARLCTHLTELTVDVSKISDDRNQLIDALKFPNFPSLKKLSITANPKTPVNDDLMEAILLNRQGLESLELRNCGELSQDLFQSWIKGYSPDRETTLVVDAMIEQELQRGYLSSTSRQTVLGLGRYSDSEAAGTVVFQGRRLFKKYKHSVSETETAFALELLKNSLILSDAARAMDCLQSLSLVGVNRLTDASIDRLSLMATYLQSLSILDAPLLSEDCVEPIRRRCRVLRSLEITGPKLRVRIDSSRFSNRRHRRKAQLPPVMGKRKLNDSEDDDD